MNLHNFRDKFKKIVHQIKDKSLYLCVFVFINNYSQSVTQFMSVLDMRGISLISKLQTYTLYGQNATEKRS